MQNLSDALLLMFLGTGFVFIFLTILVFAVSIMSKIIIRYFPEPEKAESSQSKKNSPLIAAAVSAVHMHRNKYHSQHNHHQETII